MPRAKGVATRSGRGGLIHGHSNSDNGRRTPTYITWQSMRARCRYPSVPGFRYYGARGITVCTRWELFENFLADMGERPDGCTIDRIDSDGNYEPGNCRWSSSKIQNRGSRNARLTLDAATAIRASSLSHSVLATRYGVSATTIRRVRSGVAWT